MTVRLVIDGRPVEAAPNATILEAARGAGIDIPNLCHVEGLDPRGACRLCLVEVAGRGDPVTACTTRVAEGLEVRTATPEIEATRRAVLGLILVEHPTPCLFCAEAAGCREHHGCARKTETTTGCRFCTKDARCTLQDLVARVGLDAAPFPFRYRGLEVRREDPFFDRDMNLCILCERCVRVCDEVRGASAIAMVRRGDATRVGTGYDRPLLSTTCQFCGGCVDVCPTGALVERVGRWDGHIDARTESTCPYCAVGCRIVLETRRGRLVRTAAGSGPVAGQACVRGRFAVAEVVHDPDRVLHPMARREGRLTPVPWEEAIDRAAELLAGARGRAALSAWPDLTLEDLHVADRFAREALGAAGVDLGLGPLGPGGLGPRLLSRAVPIEEILRADWILTVATRARHRHAVADLLVRRAVARGARLVSVEPWENDLKAAATVRIRVPPGGEAAALAAIRRALADGPAAAGEVAEAARTIGRGRGAVVWGQTLLGLSGAAEALGEIDAIAAATGAGAVALLDSPNAAGAVRLGVGAAPPARDVAVLYAVGAPHGRIEGAKVVLQDLRLPDVAADVEVVLPAAAPGEVDGLFVAPDGALREVRRAVDPPGACRPDWWILAAVARRIGLPGFAFERVEDVRREALARLRAAAEAPTPAPAERAAARPAPADAPPADGGGLLLLRERSPFLHRGAPVGDRVPGLASLSGDGVLRLSAADAGRLGLAEGDAAEVSTPLGKIRRVVWIERDLDPGEAYLTTLPEDEAAAPGAVPLERLGPNPCRAEVRRCTES